VFPKQSYLGIDYTDGIIFIQVTWNAGRSTEVKKAFYRKIADDLHTKADVRKQDVFISSATCWTTDSISSALRPYAPQTHRGGRLFRKAETPSAKSSVSASAVAVSISSAIPSSNVMPPPRVTVGRMAASAAAGLDAKSSA